MNHLTSLPPQARQPAQSRVERVADLLVLISACMLETLPIFCWLLMLATYDAADPNDVALPFWWMLLLLLGVTWLGRVFTRGTDNNPRRKRMSVTLLTVAVAVLGPLSLLITYWLSPAAQVFLANGSDTGGPVALALLVVWLWWRGLALSRVRLTRGRMYVRFILALVTTVTALAAAGAVQEGAARDLMASYLALLLALLLFVGTMGLTLAQARDATYQMRSAHRGDSPLSLPPVFTRSWLAASLGLSLGLSLLSLLLATLISRQSVRILAVAAGNIVNGLINAVEFVLTPIFYLIFLALNNPIEWLAGYIHKLGPYQPLVLPKLPPPCTPTPVGAVGSGTPTSTAPCAPVGSSPASSLLPAEWLVALRWGAVFLIIVVALVLLARALSRLTDWRRMREFSEERTMLDTREILGGQLRRFLDAFRRKPSEAAPATSDLRAGSVRRIYRDTLVAAAAVGRARRASETPREYQRRMTSDDPLHTQAAPPPVVAGALRALTRAYEQARYGQPAPDADTAPPAPPETVSAAEEVRRWLAHEGNEGNERNE